MKTEIHCLLDETGNRIRLEHTTHKDPDGSMYYQLALKTDFTCVAGWQGSRLSSGLGAMRDALDTLRQKVQQVENERAVIPAVGEPYKDEI